MRGQITRGILALLLATSLLLVPIRADDEEGVIDDDEYADVQRAHLIVRKFVKDELVVQGKNVTVEIDIYNSGLSTADAVKFQDVLPAEASLVEGSLEADLGKVSIGSHVKHSYVIVFNTGSVEVTLPTALVTYVSDSETNEVTEGASTAMALYVMTPVQQLQRYALQAGAYASLGFARTPSDWRNLAIIIGVVSSLLGGNWVVKKVQASNVNRKRAAALRELEKSD
ncbi:hypothetical protein VOLCADRAFT_117033 [Volvox carteri f. nagariensis]|uniref:Translocon-associated protein subunit beta n=1 Tax=Volvox carteri f. nagariensis TaxID=3068 RepID=D8TRM3_VOLCA|nr:uncharacterized protein VOLCADRAFT_117033 [Volvox carteri f. nagariensis]EFJ50017.1 hypothetical protein VOLCADRAFT_117033 [Volvox carteri f. nagariensis]|eukprot:XP_002949082.1 hypothetical protein VOLCADRAFT_117033 [Volvox carteri f. nagariensis]